MNFAPVLKAGGWLSICVGFAIAVLTTLGAGDATAGMDWWIAGLIIGPIVYTPLFIGGYFAVRQRITLSLISLTAVAAGAAVISAIIARIIFKVMAPDISKESLVRTAVEPLVGTMFVLAMIAVLIHKASQALPEGERAVHNTLMVIVAANAFVATTAMLQPPRGFFTTKIVFPAAILILIGYAIAIYFVGHVQKTEAQNENPS